MVMNVGSDMFLARDDERSLPSCFVTDNLSCTAWWVSDQASVGVRSRYSLLLLFTCCKDKELEASHADKYLR